IVQFIGVKRDVSVEVQIQEQMRHAQKMEAIGTLAGGVAHDFNNILAAIVGYTELVKAQVQDTRLRTNLEQVLVAGRRARDLVRQILTFSRQVEGERRPMQVQTIVREVLKLLRASLPATIEIHERVDLQCPTVQADPTQIHQLTMNLCTNAYQAMPDGGVLEVSLRQIEANAELREKYPHLQPGRHVLLSVADTGIGMDATLIDKIFDPFFTTREKGGGTGLGLATVHGIVTALGGVIGVESTPGVGSRFDIYLPALDTAQTAPQQRQPRTPRGNGERVLWIDDEKAILQFGKELLERLGYHVTIANGSLEGLELFRATPDAFDVVITDQTMPKMTGTQLARAIKQLRPKVPIVLSSGYSETLTDDEIRDSGIITMIEKPFTLNDMARAVRAALENRPELMKERDLPTID
ncbi:MAG TPA: response regulator, partial [Firmicutes bacterium]|nr:response regulator [Candidatus Fermentithermobacillaceae bacterium]